MTATSPFITATSSLYHSSLPDSPSFSVHNVALNKDYVLCWVRIIILGIQLLIGAY